MKSLTSSISTSWAALVAFLGAMTADQWLFVVGIMGGLLSMLVNWVYKHKEFKLKEKYYASQVKNHENKD